MASFMIRTGTDNVISSRSSSHYHPVAKGIGMGLRIAAIIPAKYKLVSHAQADGRGGQGGCIGSSGIIPVQSAFLVLPTIYPATKEEIQVTIGIIIHHGDVAIGEQVHKSGNIYF